MAKNKVLPFVFKQFSLLTLCGCLTATLFSQLGKSTVSYITSLSVTCVNTFTGEGQTEPDQPTLPPTDADSLDDPPTGDDSYLEWYVIGMLASLAGLMVTWKGAKEILHKCKRSF